VDVSEVNQLGPIAVDRAAAARRIVARLSESIRADRMMTDPLMTYAYSADASSYRLVPALVVIVDSEDDVRAVLAAARAEGLPVTFRAAGTSLSGQAIGEGVLAVLGDGFRKIVIHDRGERVTLGPAIIVANANAQLKRFNKKLGPDPASQATCKIGGVVNNNSSGMCCGVAYNTYHTMRRLKVMLTDGTILDSGDPRSRDEFGKKRPDLLEALHALHHEVSENAELVALIRRKYKIKNTVGYSLNALLDFHDPIDILTHLIVGSEGTLGFVSEVTYETIDEHPFKMTGLVPFLDPYSCGRAISRLANGGVQSTVGVTAAEYLERRALAAVEHLDVMQPYRQFFTEDSPAILIDVTAPDRATLLAETEKAIRLLREEGAIDVDFSEDEARSHALWDMRKGFIPMFGAARDTGTVMLTEDCAAPVDRLADFVIDMRKLLDRHGYEDGVLFGHALAGNLHFQMAADFSKPGETERFDRFSQELSTLVSVTYQGSLKAEHGTGRAIAPFVEAEWGATAYALMSRVKTLFDPEGLLNPGVLLNADHALHVKNLKHMTPADPVIDLCIECGFCEPACPSAQLTMTPRQRIVIARERARLRETGEDPERLAEIEERFGYAGLATCAAGNVCAQRCPVGIETGTMVFGERARRRTDADRRKARWVADHTRLAEKSMRLGIGAQALSRTIIGDGATDALASLAREASGGRVPRVGRTLRPGPGAPKPPEPVNRRQSPKDDGVPVAIALQPARGRIVYFPACPTRMFGAPQHVEGLPKLLPTPEAVIALLQRVGYDVAVPEHLDGQCCGQPWLSKGFPEEADRVGGRLVGELEALSGNGDVPVVTDASTCAKHLRGHSGEVLVADSAEFLLRAVLPHLTISRRLPSLAVHHNCSAQRLGERRATETVAAACAEAVAVLASMDCCGYAGDKGLFTPELNAWATRFVRSEIPEGCRVGVSTVSSCASGLSEHAGIAFVSLASLLEAASRP
jgi:D-lactate dehydrogenase